MRATRRSFTTAQNRPLSHAAPVAPTKTAEAKWAEFAEEAADVAAWIDANLAKFDFARSLRSAVCSFGRLTDGQLAAARRLMARDSAPVQGKEVTVAKIEQAFNAAKAEGIQRPKLRLDAFLFKPAPAGGANAGGIYVTEGEAYLGKVVNGLFRRSRDCNDDQEGRIIAAASDPLAAAVAYGQRTGCCSVCNLPLTNSESIELGIGPICRKRMGWF
jgi:hypothetical protein